MEDIYYSILLILKVGIYHPDLKKKSPKVWRIKSIIRFYLEIKSQLKITNYGRTRFNVQCRHCNVY